MRFVAFVVVILTLPVFMVWVNTQPLQRKYALTLLSVGFFLSGIVKIDASFVAWPLWPGTVRGATVSMIDTLALALIFTRRRSRIGRPLLWVMLSYLGVCTLSLVYSSVPVATFFYVFQVTLMIILAIAIAPELAVPDRLKGFLNGLAIGLVIQGAYVAWEKLHGILQAMGTMIHQNTLGIMTESAMIPLLAALLSGQRSNLLRAGVGSGLVIVAGGGSRATMAIIAVASVVLILLALVQSSTPTKLRIAGLGVLAAMVFVPLGYMTLNTRFAGTAMLVEDQQRIAMETAARAMAKDHFFGVGANLYVTDANTQGYSERSGVVWGGHTRAAPVHNAFLLARAETGWIGEFLFILLFAAPVIAGVRHAFKRRRSPDGTIALGGAVAIAAVAFHSQYEFAAQTTGPQGLLFIDIALVAGMIRIQQAGRWRSKLSAAMANPLNRKNAGATRAIVSG